MTISDVVVDERVRENGDYRPLFAQVQPYLFARPTFLALLDVFLERFIITPKVLRLAGDVVDSCGRTPFGSFFKWGFGSLNFDRVRFPGADGLLNDLVW